MRTSIVMSGDRSAAEDRCVYGPVTSRRLGQSLGVDPLPFKVCNWSCAYCQLGRTRPITNTRAEFRSPEAIADELSCRLDELRPEEVDWITVVGSGEPTLDLGLGELLRRIVERTDKPVAVITNGSLLYLPEVRESLHVAQAVMPSLDAGSATLYRRINRPHPELTFDRLLAGMRTFRSEFPGRLWVECMLVKGLNDTEPALSDLAAALDTIEPDEVHLNTPDRPPAEPWVEPVDAEGLMRATAILGDVARVVDPVPLDLKLRSDDPLGELVAIITRHPIRDDILQAVLRAARPTRAHALLAELRARDEVQRVTRHQVRFWTSAEARFPEPGRRNPGA